MMTPEQREQYERAVQLLEEHASSLDGNGIAWQAWMTALEEAPDPDDHNAVDEVASRLLRECIARGETLP